MAVYIMSDIHGYFSRMLDVLEKANFDWQNDELYILGDIIDRGPESFEMLEWAIEKAPRNIHFLLGNHEDLARNVLKININAYCNDQIQGGNDFGPWDIPYGRETDMAWAWNGGPATMQQLIDKTSIEWRKEKLLPWLNNLPFCYILTLGDKKFLMVHAGISMKGASFNDDFDPYGISVTVHVPDLPPQWSQHLLWIRDKWWHDYSYIPYDYVIFGHSPTSANWMQYLEYWLPREDRKENPFEVRGLPGEIVHISVKDGGAERICLDVGRKKSALLRLDDMKEFYSDCEEEES